MSDMFSIIQFTDADGGTVSVVNNTWVTPRKTEVYWPPVRGSKAFDQLLARQVSPDVSKWKLYGIKKIFYETDDIEKAKQKLRLVEDTSDLQTESEKENEELHKRRTQRTKRFISSDDEIHNDKHSRPPPLKKFLINKIVANKSTQNLKEREYVEDMLNAATADTTLTSNVFSEDFQERDKAEDILCNVGANLSNLSNSFLEGLEQDEIVQLDNCEEKNDTIKLTGFQTKVLSLLSVIKTQNEEIIHILKQKNDAGVTLRPEFKFPVNTNEELNAVEIKLKNKDNYNNLVSYLKVLGGKDTSGRVFRIMKFLLTDQLAEKYNFYGKRSNKLPFNELRLRDCIVEGVVTSTSGTTEKDVEDFIKVWLKHAPERAKKVHKKSLRL